MIRRVAFVLAGLAIVLGYKGVSRVWAENVGKPVLITGAIDESRLFTLRGNTRPEANAKNDRGPVADDFRMEHMFLQLKRAPETEAALKEFMDQQQDKKSPNFRHWLMPAELGQKYGLADSDIATIKSWLEVHGFTVGYIYPTTMVVDFSGTAGQLREAFHTDIHNLDVNGELHYANMNDPRIPEALAPAIAGIVQMHNFKPHHFARPKVQPAYNLGGGNNEVTPADWQTIYNISPLYREGIYGQGQTIVVVEDTNSYGTDFATYQTAFGLTKYGGSLSPVHPNAASNCTNPGTNADDGEADLDVEMVAAIAPGATVELASCSDGSGNSQFRRPHRGRESGQRGHAACGDQHELRAVRGDQRRNRQRGLQQCVSIGRGGGCFGFRFLRRRRYRCLLRQRSHILHHRHRNHRLGRQCL